MGLYLATPLLEVHSCYGVCFHINNITVYTASGSNIVIICIQLIALHLIDKLPHYRDIAKLI